MFKTRYARRLFIAIAAGGVLAIVAGVLLFSSDSVSATPAKTFETGQEGMSAWYAAAVSRVDSPVPHAGTYSLRVQPKGTNWGVEETWPGTFTVAQGTSYRFSAWTKSDTGDTAVKMSVVWIAGGNRQLREDTVFAASTLPREWSEKSRTLTAPRAATSVVFRFTGTGRGSWQLDDITGAPTSAPTTYPPAATTATPAPTSTTTAAATTTTTTTAPPATTSATTATCANPAFVTSTADDGWSDGGYYVHNNLWNAADYQVSQKLAACSYRDWSVTATADNNNGDGAVKTYPNVHKDYHDWDTGKEPPLSDYPRITSTFATQSPRTGIYNVAYDIWLNGVPGDREIMIWTDNYRQSPAGDRVADGLSFSGTTWDLYATDDNEYLAFVPAKPMTKGSLDLTAFLNYLVKEDRVPANSTLGQICFGVEIVSTDGKPATFQVTDFSITD